MRLRVCWNCLQTKNYVASTPKPRRWIYVAPHMEDTHAVVYASQSMLSLITLIPNCAVLEGLIFSPSYNFHTEGACNLKCTHTPSQSKPRNKVSQFWNTVLTPITYQVGSIFIQDSDLFARWEEKQKNVREEGLEQLRLQRQAAYVPSISCIFKNSNELLQDFR